jgi:TetR/AcrR family transcriptional regulator, transcriptional repressor for nem operon
VRYSETHKAETHMKLVKLAGRALREKGPDKLSVADLMALAGLTHGGFYAHFSSKDALLAEALAGIFEESTQKLDQLTAGLPPIRALVMFIDSYVSPAHRDRASTGCPIVALNSDLPRQSRKFRAAFDAGVRRLTGALANLIEAAGRTDSGKLAAFVLSAMAGAVVVSRAVSDQNLSDELLAAARENIKARLGLHDTAHLEGAAR